MSLQQTQRARRVLLGLATAGVIGASGVGMAYASSASEVAPLETGYVQVDTEASGTSGTGSTVAPHDCDERKHGGSDPQGSSAATGTPAPSTDPATDLEGRL